MTIISWILSAVLGTISAVHFYWAIGGLWPGTDETSLARTVIGQEKMKAMPPRWLTALVALCIAAASIIPLMWSAVISYAVPQGLVWIAMWVLILVFFGRGIAGYLAFFRKQHSAQPFADLNRKYYSPLCLLIGAGFVMLIYLAGV